MSKRNALGKGLGAIFTDLVEDGADKPKFTVCGIEELRPNRFQPRKEFGGEEKKNLIASVKKNGIIQPIIVRKDTTGYEIIAGERRWRAAQAAGLKDVPIVIREAEDRDLAELSLIENIQREELNPLEEAEAYQTLSDTFHLSQEDISHRVGKERSTITNSLRLLKLPRDAKEAIVRKKITAGHARALLALKTESAQSTALKDIVRRNLSVRETERLIKRMNEAPPAGRKPVKDRAVFDIEERLSKYCMSKVNIRQSRKGGSIEIKFTSNDDLDRLIRLILQG